MDLEDKTNRIKLPKKAEKVKNKVSDVIFLLGSADAKYDYRQQLRFKLQPNSSFVKQRNENWKQFRHHLELK